MFFVLSKIFWVLVRPESLLLLLAAAGFGLLLRDRRRAGSVCLAIAIIAVVSLGVFPLGNIVIHPLETAYPAQPAVTDPTGIIMLGGSEEIDRSTYWLVPLTNGAGDRYLATLSLAHRFPKAKVLFSGGRGSLDQSGPSEATVARAIFVSAGLDPSRLLLETKSRNTAENALFSRMLVGGAPKGTWILVTSAWHMPRAMEAFCAAGWHHLVAWPTDYRSGAFWSEVGWDLPHHLRTLDLAVHEWIGLIAYRLTGRARACR